MRRKGSQFHTKTHPGLPARDEEWDYRGSHHEEWSGPYTSTTYTYSPEQLGEVSAEMTVSNNPARSYTRYPPADMMQPDTDPEEAYDVNSWYPAPGQIPLFRHESNKAYDVVTGMGSTKASRVPAMTMLGLAANDAASRGVTLSPSRNLSEHSLGMVQNLANRGAIDQDKVPAATGNDSTFWEQPSTDNPMAWAANHGYEEIGPQRLAAGRRTLRSILGRNASMGNVQGTLF